MPITYTISRQERLIKAYATGIIRADDLNGFVDALLADPDLGPGLRALNDAGIHGDAAVLRITVAWWQARGCLLYTSPSPRDRQKSRMPSSA